MDRLILAIDQGTTSSRAIVIDGRSRIRSVAQRPVASTFPHPGWVNQDAGELWRTTLAVVREAIAGAGIQPAALGGIGIANQRETTILWDRATGEPVAPAIVWQSRQSSALIDDLARRGKAELYQETTGLVPDAYFSATKIAWLLQRESGLRRRAEAGEIAFGTVDSWLMWKLSGGRVHLIEASNASRTMLYDIRAGVWSSELLAYLGIPAAILPRVVGSSGVVFESEATVLGASVPVAGVAGDQQAALFGQSCFRPGQAKNTYGTGSFLLMNTGRTAVRSTNRLLSTIAWAIAGEVTYALEGAIFVTGSAVQWLRDGLGIIDEAADVEALAGSVPDSGGVVFVPALVGLGAPHWDQHARGTIFGITRGTTRAHLARATLEGIAFQTCDVLDAMTADSGVTLTELRVDGGAATNDLLMQIQADALGVPVVRPRFVETTAFGAAYLAGLATGVWSGLDAIEANRQEERRFEPSASATAARPDRDRWREAVARSRGWVGAGF